MAVAKSVAWQLKARKCLPCTCLTRGQTLQWLKCRIKEPSLLWSKKPSLHRSNSSSYVMSKWSNTQKLSQMALLEAVKIADHRRMEVNWELILTARARIKCSSLTSHWLITWIRKARLQALSMKLVVGRVKDVRTRLGSGKSVTKRGRLIRLSLLMKLRVRPSQEVKTLKSSHRLMWRRACLISLLRTKMESKTSETLCMWILSWR